MSCLLLPWLKKSRVDGLTTCPGDADIAKPYELLPWRLNGLLILTGKKEVTLHLNSSEHHLQPKLIELFPPLQEFELQPLADTRSARGSSHDLPRDTFRKPHDERRCKRRRKFRSCRSDGGGKIRPPRWALRYAISQISSHLQSAKPTIVNICSLRLESAQHGTARGTIQASHRSK